LKKKPSGILPVANYFIYFFLSFAVHSNFKVVFFRRDVIIHVCDETRDAKKDFTCPQDLLLSQMGYFRDITSGQSLEDVDISVHCDVTIFEWLMDWLKAQARDEYDLEPPPPPVKAIEDTEGDDKESSEGGPLQEPELTANNVVSILVSASFLKMGPLVDYALMFLHQNMNKVLATTHNLNCLGEPLLTRYYTICADPL